jgi:hypothetical protein
VNGTILAVFIIAVVLWLAISLILIVSKAGDLQTKDRQTLSEPEETAETEAGTEPVREQWMLDSPSNFTWQEQLKHVPGLSGWVLIEATGEVIDSSEERFETIGASLSKLLGWIHQNTGDLGFEPLHLLELDTEKGSIIVLFPSVPEEQARLVLFLDTETYKNQIRETLSQLNWESNLKVAYES